jgi:proto-oncogene serine/threonine-protein kinase Pim-1
VAHIHSCGVVHRDIKDENVILNRDTGEVKLIDFGCGTLLKEAPFRDFSGTPEFYPPEWFQRRVYHAR